MWSILKEEYSLARAELDFIKLFIKKVLEVKNRLKRGYGLGATRTQLAALLLNSDSLKKAAIPTPKLHAVPNN